MGITKPIIPLLVASVAAAGGSVPSAWKMLRARVLKSRVSPEPDKIKKVHVAPAPGTDMTTDDASSDQGGNQVLSPEAVSPSHNKVKMADIVGLSQTVLKATQKLRRVATVPPTESHIQVLPEVGRTQLSFKGPGCWFMTLEDSAALAGTEKRMKLIPPPIDSVSCPLLFQRADLKLQHNQASQAWLIENSPSGPYLECGIFNRPYMILWDERLIGFAKGIERRVIVPYDDWLRGRFPEMDHICNLS